MNYCVCSSLKEKFFRLLVTIIIIINSVADVTNGVVNITSLSVPAWVETGTTESVILDCDYTLDEEEDKHLVVKWFHGNDPVPIYQWIPQLESRTASARFEEKINMNFKIGENPMTKYRGIQLMRPTVDLSGRYSCHVMSRSSLKIEEKEMTVYALPKIFEFNYTKGTPEVPAALKNQASVYGSDNQEYKLYEGSPGTILTCDIRDVYPIPEVTLYRISSDGSHPHPLTVFDSQIQIAPSRAYNVKVRSSITDLELIKRFGDQPSIFECLVSLQLSNRRYEQKKNINYIPDIKALLVKNKGFKANISSTGLCLTILLVFHGLIINFTSWLT